MSQNTPTNQQILLLNPTKSKSKKPKQDKIKPRKPYGIYLENHFELLEYYEKKGAKIFKTNGIIVGANLDVPSFYKAIKPLK